MFESNLGGEYLAECIILCGGAAKRMKPYLPFNKALAKINCNITLIEYQFKWLIKSGIDRVILAINRQTYTALKEMELPFLDKTILSIEEEKLGTGGAIYKAVEHVRDHQFYVMNVDDILISQIYTPKTLIKTLAENQGASGSILLAKTRFPFGIVETQSHWVKGFKQKPWLDYKICSGHYAFTKEGVMKYFPKQGNFEKTALQRMAQDKSLTSKEFDGEWITINNIKQLESAQRRLTQELI